VLTATAATLRTSTLLHAFQAHKGGPSRHPPRPLPSPPSPSSCLLIILARDLQGPSSHSAAGSQAEQTTHCCTHGRQNVSCRGVMRHVTHAASSSPAHTSGASPWSHLCHTYEASGAHTPASSAVCAGQLLVQIIPHTYDYHSRLQCTAPFFGTSVAHLGSHIYTKAAATSLLLLAAGAPSKGMQPACKQAQPMEPSGKPKSSPMEPLKTSSVLLSKSAHIQSSPDVMLPS
jgi:hypothetical protein